MAHVQLTWHGNQHLNDGTPSYAAVLDTSSKFTSIHTSQLSNIRVYGIVIWISLSIIIGLVIVISIIIVIIISLIIQG